MPVRASNHHLFLCVAGCTAAIVLGCKEGSSSPTPRLLDLTGRYVNPLQTPDADARVFLFTRTDCPISNRYAPEVRRLFEKFAPKNVVFWLVYPDADETVEAIRDHVKEYSYPCGALRDPRHLLVQMTGATVTPEAAVFDCKDRMVYRGRIDDRYVDFGKTRAKSMEHDLEAALKATLEGRSVTRATTPAVGCPIPDLP